MNRMLILIVLMLIATNASASCLMADREYSPGASICECPSMTSREVERGFNNVSNSIKSRRLVCTTHGDWKADESLCLDLSYDHTLVEQPKNDFDKYTAAYCPRVPVNEDEVKKKMAEATSSFFNDTTKTVASVAVRTICMRFKVGATCDAVLSAVEAPHKD